MYPKKVYVVRYEHIGYFDEWFNTLPEAIFQASIFGGKIYSCLIPNNSWNFYDVGDTLACVAVIHSSRKWRIKSA